MECGKLTAKLRDAVPVCFIEDGKEIRRYRNIEIPDELKALHFMDYKFDVSTNGAITFKIMFETGILPTEWPQARERKQRTTKSAAALSPESMPGEASEGAAESEEIKPEAEQTINENVMEETDTEPETPATMEIAFNVTGDRRKALVEVVSSFLSEKAIYMNAPTFGYTISSYTVDKKGTLIGPTNDQLLQALAARDFIAE